MRRGFVAGAILATWVGALAWLVARQSRGGGDQLAGLEDRLPPSDAYLALRLGDEQIGIVSGTLDTVGSGGARTVERVDLQAVGRDGVRRRVLSSEATYGPGLALRQLSVIRSGDGDRFRLLAELDSSRQFTVRVTSGSDTASWHWQSRPRAVVRTVASALRYLGLTRDPVERSPVLLLDPSSLDWAGFEARLTGDTTLAVPDSAAMDPATGRWVEARWDTVAARRIEYVVNGLPFDAWVDADGNLVRSATPLGAELVRSAFEIVRQDYRPGSAPAGGESGAPRLGLPPGRRGGWIARLTVVLVGADTTLPAWRRLDLDTPFQHRRGDTLEVEAATLPEPAAAPPSGGEEAALTRPSGSVPASHPLVEAQARRIAGQGTDPAQVSREVARWVAAEVVPDPGGPDHPVAALERRRGSAEGRTTLFVAMLRALGIPARPVAGLRWDGTAFHYHGWAEVRVRGTWLPVDVALGQFPADGSRLRLATGIGADPLGLAPLIGRVRPRILHVESAR
jgi:transglutaminase-like putative cysteine protease